MARVGWHVVGSVALVTRGPGVAWSLRVVGAVLLRPTLWVTALRQARRLAPTGWWHRFPFLPVPDRDYLRFRIVTAYGGDGTRTPDTADLLTYLQWCRAWPAVTGQKRY